MIANNHQDDEWTDHGEIRSIREDVSENLNGNFSLCEEDCGNKWFLCGNQYVTCYYTKQELGRLIQELQEEYDKMEDATEEDKEELMEEWEE